MSLAIWFEAAATISYLKNNDQVAAEGHHDQTADYNRDRHQLYMLPGSRFKSALQPEDNAAQFLIIIGARDHNIDPGGQQRDDFLQNNKAN